MKKFLVLYHVPMTEEAMQEMINRPAEEMQKGMEAWMQWKDKMGEHLVEMGSPLMNGQKLKADGTDSNCENHVSGYSIVQAEDMEAAKKLMSGHPHISNWNPEATIEIHEFMPMPGM
jgi:hypothetical protein